MKKGLSIILMLCMLLSMAACTSDSNRGSEAWQTAEAGLASCSSAEFDVSIKKELNLGGEISRMSEEDSVKYTATETDYLYFYTSDSDSGKFDIYYNDGFIFENGIYGTYKAQMSAEDFSEYISSYVPGIGGVSPDNFSEIGYEKTSDGCKVTATGADEQVLQLISTAISSLGVPVLPEECTVKIEMEITEDGQYRAIKTSYTGETQYQGENAVITVEMEKNFKSINGEVQIELPENLDSYIEVSDIDIPKIFTYAYMYYASSADHNANVNFILDLESNAGDMSCSYDIDISSGRDDNGKLKASMETELASLGETYSFSETYENGQYTLKNISGEETSEELDYEDMLDYIYTFLGWYSDSLPYIKNLSMTQEDGNYVITYAYTEDYTDADIDKLLSYVYSEFDGLIYNCLEWSYDHSNGILVIDGDSFAVISHTVSHEATYTFDDDVWHITMEGSITEIN